MVCTSFNERIFFSVIRVNVADVEALKDSILQPVSSLHPGRLCLALPYLTGSFI